MADGSVVIDTLLNDEGLDKGVKNIGNSFNKLKSIAITAIGAIGFGNLVKEGVAYNATIEQLQTSFEVMTGSAQKSLDIVEELKEIGAKTPFEFTGLAETTQLLMNYGLEADDAIDKMMMLGDISQGSAEKMNRIAMAYGQMSSAGKVSLEDVKQMIEAGFNPLQEISQSTGESMASLYDRISKGAIAVNEITASMERSTSAGGKYFQSMEKQSKTLNGQWSTLKDNFSNFLGKALEPVNDLLATKILPALNEFLSKLGEKIETVDWEKFGNTLETILSIIIPLTAAVLAYKAAISISSIIQTVTTALNGMTIAQYALNLAMSLNPVGLVVAAIAGLIAIFVVLWNNCEGFREFWINLWEGIKAVVSTAVNFVVEWFNKIVDFVKNNWQNILTFIANPFVGAFKLLYENCEGFKNFVDNLIEKVKNIVISGWNAVKNFFTQTIPNMVTNIINWFKKLPENLKNIGLNLVKGLWNGINDAKNWIWNKISGFCSSILNSIKGFFGIHSPSKLFADEIGKNLGLGIGEGFDDSLSSVYKSMQKAVEYENAKLTSNLTSTHQIQVTNEDNRQAILSSIDNNREIQVNSTLEVDGNKMASIVNKVNAKQKLQYGFA